MVVPDGPVPSLRHSGDGLRPLTTTGSGSGNVADLAVLAEPRGIVGGAGGRGTRVGGA